MMQLYHTSCRFGLPFWLRFLPLWIRARIASTRTATSRMLLHNQNADICTRTYRCERCGSQVHVDMDWEEGATPEARATIA